MRRKHSQATAPPSGNYAPKAQKASERAHTGITALDPYPPGTCRNLPEPPGTYPVPPGTFPEPPGTLTENQNNKD